MRNDPRGFTLIEILVALVIFGTVATVLTRLLITSQRVTTSQSVRASLQSNLRVGSMVVPNELRMLNQSDSTDIQSVTDTSISYRAMRGYYVLCEPITSATSLKMVRVSTNQGYTFDYRAPTTGDSLFIFFENDTLKISDDRWLRHGITGTAASTCANWPTTGANTAALTITLGGSGIVNATYPWTNFITGAPIRTFEITTLSLMSSGGQKWLGMCTGDPGTCTLEPVVGPLASTNGFVITRYDDEGDVVTGNSFSDRNSLRSLKIQFIGVGEQQINRAGGPTGGFSTIQDTLTTVVTLRNVKQN